MPRLFRHFYYCSNCKTEWSMESDHTGVVSLCPRCANHHHMPFDTSLVSQENQDERRNSVPASS